MTEFVIDPSEIARFARALQDSLTDATKKIHTRPQFREAIAGGVRRHFDSLARGGNASALDGGVFWPSNRHILTIITRRLRLGDGAERFPLLVFEGNMRADYTTRGFVRSRASTEKSNEVTFGTHSSLSEFKARRNQEGGVHSTTFKGFKGRHNVKDYSDIPNLTIDDWLAP